MNLKNQKTLNKNVVDDELKCEDHKNFIQYIIYET